MDFRSNPRIAACARALLNGQVVAYPTEAVWGLGCDPFDVSAVQEILTLKQRPAEKGLILVAANIEQFDFILRDLAPEHRQLLLQKWPGPRTYLVPHFDRIPRIVSGDHASVALRVSAHPVVSALCLLTGGPIVSTSANPQARPPARYGFQARKYFGRRVYYAPGQVNLNAKPSQICDLLTGQIIRP